MVKSYPDSNEKREFRRSRSRSFEKERRRRDFRRSSREKYVSPRRHRRSPKKIDAYSLHQIILDGKNKDPSGLYERAVEQRLRKRLMRG